MLTSARGKVSRVSARHVLPVISASGLEAIVSKRGLREGPIGSPLRALSPFGRCSPLRQASDLLSPSPLLALSGSKLYAIVSPRCLGHRGYGRAALLVRTLRGAGSWRLLGPVPTGAVNMTAAGAWLALGYLEPYTYEPGTPQEEESHRLTVAVYSTLTGHRVYRVLARTSSDPGRPPITAVDDLGDVLVTETAHLIPASRSFGWWATPISPFKHELFRLGTTAAGLTHGFSKYGSESVGEAALSQGRLAYVSGGEIRLLDLRHRKTRTVARFRGEAHVLGLDLQGDVLTWAQQNTLPVGHRGVLPGGGNFSCEVVPLDKPELESVNLKSLGPAPTIGKPLPEANRPPCTEEEM